MLRNTFTENSIIKIARVLPLALIESDEKHPHYSIEYVKGIFKSKFKYEHNLEYAFAMFCSQQDFEELNLDSNYNDLRKDVSKNCFEGWPRFNFDSLLDYSRRSMINGDSGGYAGDGFGGDAGCVGGE